MGKVKSERKREHEERVKDRVKEREWERDSEGEIKRKRVRMNEIESGIDWSGKKKDSRGEKKTGVWQKKERKERGGRVDEKGRVWT